MAYAEKERLIEMHEPRWSSVWTWFGFLGMVGLVWALQAWAITMGPGWLVLPLVLVLAHLYHSHLLAFHEAAHGSLCPDPRWNDRLGVFIGMFGFMVFSLFRAVHHSHHAYLTTERDEELWPFVKTDKPRWFRRLAAVLELGLGLVYTPGLFLRAFLRKGSIIQNRARRRRIWAEIVLMAAVWSGIVAATARWDAWKLLLVMFVGPASLAGFMQSLRKYIEHMGLTGSTVLSSTRTIVSPGRVGRFLAFTLFHEPYHGVHHKFARLPHSVLPMFTADLTPTLPDEICPFPTYRNALKDMIGSLSDPRIGAQWLRISRDGNKDDRGRHRLVSRYPFSAAGK
jgi:fatty acid desaturase